MQGLGERRLRFVFVTNMGREVMSHVYRICPPLAVYSAIDYRCDKRRFGLSARNCQVPTPSSQNLEVEQQVRIFTAD
jgi:hypothetical protein